MINGRKIEQYWKDFCKEHTLVLSEDEKNYYYGKTRIYSTKEAGENFEIKYSFRFENPNIDVRPEELNILFLSNHKDLIQLEVKRSTLFKRIFRRDSIISSQPLNDKLISTIRETIQKFPSIKVNSKEKQIGIILNQFVNSEELNFLREFVMDLYRYSNQHQESSNQYPASTKLDPL